MSIQGFNGIHRTSATHVCMIDKTHFHSNGDFEHYFREIPVNIGRGVSSEELLATPFYDPLPDVNAAITENADEQIQDFAGEECPVCELFGRDKHELVQLNLPHWYGCNSGHMLTQGDMERITQENREATWGDTFDEDEEVPEDEQISFEMEMHQIAVRFFGGDYIRAAYYYLNRAMGKFEDWTKS